MATKSGILATINGYITAIVTVANHRLSMSALVDEMYSDAVTDNQTTEIYTTKSGTDITYTLTVKKDGNKAFAKLVFRNTTPYPLPALDGIFTWKDTPYKPKVTVNDFPIQAFEGANEVKLFLGSGGVSLSTPLIPTTGTFYTSFEFYITQD